MGIVNACDCLVCIKIGAFNSSRPNQCFVRTGMQTPPPKLDWAVFARSISDMRAVVLQVIRTRRPVFSLIKTGGPVTGFGSLSGDMRWSQNALAGPLFPGLCLASDPFIWRLCIKLKSVVAYMGRFAGAETRWPRWEDFAL